MNQPPETVTIPPQHSAQFGKAWQMDLEAARRNFGQGREDAGVVEWIIEAPWAHPFWHSYALTMVHLRPMADKRETVFYLDGATHELILHALDPGKPRTPVILGTAAPAWLLPANFAAQFVAASDEAARERIEQTVRLIVNGNLSPDTDYIRQWMHLWGDNMIRGDKRRAGETCITVNGHELVIPPRPGPQDMH